MKRLNGFCHIRDSKLLNSCAHSENVDFVSAERLHCFRWLEHLQHVADPLTNEPIGDTFTNLQAAITSELHVLSLHTFIMVHI